MTSDAINAMENDSTTVVEVETTFVNDNVVRGFLDVARDTLPDVQGLLPLVQVQLVADISREMLEGEEVLEITDPESHGVKNTEAGDETNSRDPIVASAPATLVPNESTLEIHVTPKYTTKDKKRGRKKTKKDEDWLVTCLGVVQLGNVETSDHVLTALKQALSVAKFNPRNRVSVFSVNPHVTVTKNNGVYSISITFGVFAKPFDGHVNPEIHMAGHLNIVNVIRQFLGVTKIKQLHKNDYVTPEYFYECLELKDDTEVEINRDLQPEGMRSKLLDYQLETVGWVLDREKGESREKTIEGIPSPWKRFRAHGINWLVDFVGLNIGPEKEVMEILTRDTKPTTEDPEIQAVSRDADFKAGYGLIADEMGLGKTVELLAVVLNNPRPEFPPQTHYDLYSDRDVLPTKTTLILCPASISQQWIAEVTKHAPSLSVFLYTGRAALDAQREKEGTPDTDIEVGIDSDTDSEGPLVSKHAQFLSQFDIVVTSYEVASREVANALYNPLRGRVTRTKTKLKSKDTRDVDLVQDRLSLQSPLSQLQFWRVILDEVQMVGNTVSNAAVVARIIPRVHAWGVSGTPIKKGMPDLLGMCVFLRCEPGEFYGRSDYAYNYSWQNGYLSTTMTASGVSHQKHWEMLMLDKPRFRDVIRQMSIRHTKRQVRDQLVLPPQERHHVRLRFNLVEEENYRHLREGVESAVSEAVASSLMREEREATREAAVVDRYGVLPSSVTPPVSNRPRGTFNIGGSNPYASIMANINNTVIEPEIEIDPSITSSGEGDGQHVYTTWSGAVDTYGGESSGTAASSTDADGDDNAQSPTSDTASNTDINVSAIPDIEVSPTATPTASTRSQNGTSAPPASSAPADLTTATLSSWLLRLRQTCCHPRVGSGNKKALGNGILQTVSHVLDAMCDQALTQLLNDERSLFVEELEKARVHEFNKQPDIGLTVLQSRVSEVEVRTGEIRDMAVAAATRYAMKKKEVISEWKRIGEVDNKRKLEESDDGAANVKKVKVEKEEKEEEVAKEEVSEDFKMEGTENNSIFGAPTAFLGSDSESESTGKMSKPLQKYLNNSEELQTEKERKQAFLHRYRSWMDLMHRYYFFIATFHFQVGEAKKVAEEKKEKEDGKDDEEKEDEEKEEIEVKKEEDEGTKSDDLETHYYTLAEQIRTQLLQRPIERVDQDVGRLERAKELEMVQIPVDTLTRDLVQASPFLEARVSGLLEIINQQSEYLEEWMTRVRELLVARDEKDVKETDEKKNKGDVEKVEGENTDPYASGLDNQQYASDYLDAISYLLQLRDEALNAKTTASAADKIQVNLWYHNDYEEELTDLQVALKEALDACHVSPTLGALKPIVAALKTDSGAVSLSIYNPKWPPKLLSKLNPIVKTVTSTTKACRDLLSVVRSCFNSKVVYYKQLQQLSDNVSSLEELIEPGYVTLERLNAKINHLVPLIKRTKGRITYLQSLKGDDDTTGVSNMTGIHKMCVICQDDYIIVGSITVCGHYFCRNCLEEWWQTHNTCPMCKTVLSRDDVFSFTQQDKEDKSRAGSFAARINQDDAIGAMYAPVSEDTQQLMSKQSIKSAYGTKIDHVIKYIKMLTHRAPGTQIVIFSQWAEILTLLASALTENKIAYAEPKTLMSFLQSEEVTCFLLNAKFQSTGLTLVNATHVILCEPILNAALEAQAISRIHRMGQTQTTHVTIFTMADTVEEEVLRLAINKRLKSMDGDETFEENESRHVTSGVGALATDKSGEVVNRQDMWDALFPSDG
ncbi:SNF2 family N-terminal domain-domain-containing protein [Yarrowia lipolytica]|uniref:YALI0C07150p n=2 Tax=Yarrowia lipolytica TaxID=4952 RepID=Q6CCR7_YARLI|nr:YALI0C07150p [Yarrowia lipolytica CLIB122]RDW24613.1 SNF2 family N-terminal domain-domain-containing protein [Yarrowia lipolytica]RDW32305.1 SNF2 family N-terminal domain-domain-containing protein [Yarrowia lipolytica]RDW39047.1 SNF2 family N-terminal domain-domain-containing protein [Yarrowia lipolytica]RDW48166.1 SNF2 family N-terminal domain-domain-containing protein [Yarrowia lipolytica]RDW54957.1 SNF2 family N-terminal domain-domain-containing protein [Yarrowia lipolytica]|eukprot:XP_501545.1 YALI0C07150p [Yarrowia lipolytica CLIB122]